MSAVKQRGLCLVVVLLGVAAACGKPVAGEPRAVENAVRTTSTSVKATARVTSRPSATRVPSSTRPSGTPSNSDVLRGLVGIWDGEYTCGQGNTGLLLTIKPPQGEQLPATFAFFPLASNPSAKQGSYTMVGTLAERGKLVFKQQQWIDQPPGYVMIDLAVTSPLAPDTTSLSGDVLMDNCKGFSVRKR